VSTQNENNQLTSLSLEKPTAKGNPIPVNPIYVYKHFCQDIKMSLRQTESMPFYKASRQFLAAFILYII
jgi:hypothetical protein